MLTLWRVRSLVCLLLAVSTAIGGIAPVRACACGIPAKAPSTPPKTNPTAVVPPPATAKACCQPGAKKRSCCSPTSAGVGTKAPCCGDEAAAERPAKSSAALLPADATGCHCLRCECDTPDVPAPTAPAPVAPDLDEYAAVSPVPTVPTSGPPSAAPRAVRVAPVIPPTDLTISLSRLTC